MTRSDQAITRSLTGRGPWLRLILLCTAQFLLILDISVANVALPSIGAELGLDPGLLTWVVTLYLLMFGGLMILGGRVADVVGAKRTILVGLAVFAAASFVAGLAMDPVALLAGRAGQGLGAAFISPAALSLVTTSYIGEQRTRALAVWAGVGATGAVAGVILGGLLVAGPGWRWAFLVTGPAALVLLAMLSRLVPAGSRGGSGRLDVGGALLITGATALLIYGLTGPGEAGWTFPLTPLVLLGALVGYLAFGLYEWRRPHPLFALALLRGRDIRAGILLMLVASALMAGNFFLASFYLQQTHGWTPLATGLAFVPAALSTLSGAHLGGHLVAARGPRPVAIAGLLTVVAGAGIAAGWMNTTSVIVGMAVCGLGLGTTFVVATTTALARVEHDSAGVVSGIVNTFHELGAAVGVASLSAIAIGSLSGGPDAGFVNAWATAGVLALLTAAAATFALPAGRLPAGTARFMH